MEIKTASQSDTLSKVVEKTLIITNKTIASPIEKIEVGAIKSVVRFVDGEVKFVPNATTSKEKSDESRIHTAFEKAKGEVLSEQLVGIARDLSIAVENNRNFLHAFEKYIPVPK